MKSEPKGYGFHIMISSAAVLTQIFAGNWVAAPFFRRNALN